MGITKTPFSYFRATLATWEKLANRNLLHIFALRFVWPNFTIHFFFFGIPNKQFDALHTTNFHLFPNFLPLLINLRIRIFRLLQQFALINAYKLVAFMYSANVTLEIHRVTTCQNYFNAILIYFFPIFADQSLTQSSDFFDFQKLRKNRANFSLSYSRLISTNNSMEFLNISITS